MRALVLGGNGFIGSHVVEALLAKGVAVRIMDIAPRRPCLDWPDDVEFVMGSLADSNLLADVLQDVDIVYHLVSTTVPSTSNLDPVADVQSNLIATVSLLEVMRRVGTRRIVFLSSGGTVYGNPQSDPVPEEHPLNPVCSYGVVKVAIENYLTMYESLYGFEALILRVSNPYGPRQGNTGIQGVIATFLGSVRAGKPLKIWGDGSVVRDFIHVRDLAELCALSAASTVSGTFNVGSGRGSSIMDVVDAIREATGAAPEIEFLPQRNFDVKRVVLDISRVTKAFAWEPRTALVDGIRETWDGGVVDIVKLQGVGE